MALEIMKENVQIIQSLSDYPNQEEGLTAGEMKAKFDEAAVRLQAYLNGEVVPAVNEKVNGVQLDEAVADAVSCALATETEKLAAAAAELIPKDSILSDTSENPVQNKVLHAALAGKISAETARPLNNSLEGLHTNGWYQCSGETVGVPTGHNAVQYGTVFVINRWGQHTVQLYITQPDDVLGSPLMLVRGYSVKNAGWNPWEWINPPMVLGVEYRTTERHNGAVVYTKLINCGTLSNGATVPLDTSISVIRFAARATNKIAYPFQNPDSAYFRKVIIEAGKITMLCGSSAAGADTVHCQIWYVKD